MNRRVLFAGVGLVVLIIIGIALWVIAGRVGEDATPSPSPVPVISAGILPIGSTDPFATPSPSQPPIVLGGICPDTWISGQDTDRDSLPDATEGIYGTDENKTDTDGDGYGDGEEVRAGYNPLSASGRLDSDVDGLLDNDECILRTDPFAADSDLDGFQDGAEVKNGFDPTKKGDGRGSNRLLVPTPSPSPSPTFNPGFSPTPIPTDHEQPTPVVSQNPTGTQLTLVPLSELQINSKTSAADVKAYLTQIDSLRPEEFSDGQVIASAIQNAANGNVQPLTQARTRIAQFLSALKSTSTPKPAQEYQQLYVSLIGFTIQQLQIIELNATGANQQKAVQAVLDIQNVLPPYVTKLAQLRQAVEGIANK